MTAKQAATSAEAEIAADTLYTVASRLKDAIKLGAYGE